MRGRGRRRGTAIAPEAAKEIARRSRGTPRIANRLLRRVRDFSEVRGDGTISEETAREGLRVFGVDEIGLGQVDRAILNAICQQFAGGPVGLSTLAISVGDTRQVFQNWLSKHKQFHALHFALEPAGIDGKGFDSKLYHVDSYPTQFVIDPTGKVQASFVGYDNTSEKQLADAVPQP